MGGSSRSVMIIAASVGVVCIVLGFLIGWFSSPSNTPNDNEAFNIWMDALADGDTGIGKMIQEEMMAENIKENLK